MSKERACAEPGRSADTTTEISGRTPSAPPPWEAEQQTGLGLVSTAEHQPRSPTMLGGNTSSHRLNALSDRRNYRLRRILSKQIPEYIQIDLEKKKKHFIQDDQQFN